jgi:MFS family permease
VKTIFSERFLCLFIPSALILNFLGGGVFAMAQPFILQRGFPVEYYGYLMSVYTVAQLICVVLLGIVKLSPKARFWMLALGFTLSVPLMTIGYSATNFVVMCVFIFLGAFCNCAGNTIFNASLMLALPEENRGAILGFIQSACTGGIALSTVIYGVLGDVFPLYLVFIGGGLLSLVPMLYLCFHPNTKEFVLTH